MGEKIGRGKYKIRVGANGQITLPAEIRILLAVNAGDILIFSQAETGQVIVEKEPPAPPDQAWFWTERWQALEHQAQADIDAGRVESYTGVDEAIRALNGKPHSRG